MTYVGHGRPIDRNARDIEKHLSDIGASVQRITALRSQDRGVPDLIVGWGGVNFLIEIKADDGGLKDSQEEWHRRWKGKPVAVVRSPVEALRAIGAL